MSGFMEMFDNHEAPPAPEKGIQITEREVGWQANRDDTTKPYVNRETPRHIQEAMTIEQIDYSYYEFDNLAFGRNPRDAFGAKVKQAFGTLEKGFNFKDEKARYQKLYKKMMSEL